jgi:hypothetical protein
MFSKNEVMKPDAERSYADAVDTILFKKCPFICKPHKAS